MTHALIRIGLLSVLLAVPKTAWADGSDITAMFVGIIDVFAPVWISVAILVTVIAGLTLMLSQDENALTKARSTMTAVIIGSVLVTIILTVGATNVVGFVYNGISGQIFINNSDAIATEAIGFADWIATIAVILGVFIVIIAATRAVASFGDEGAYAQVRSSVLHVIIGLIIIAGAYIFQQTFFFDREPTSLLQLLLSPLLVIIGIIGLIAVAILMYAGLRMIISFGKEDEFTAARSLAVRVVIGLLVLLLSFTLIAIILAVF